MKAEFELDSDAMDQITLENLMNAYDIVYNGYQGLKVNKKDLLPHQKQDLKDNRKQLKFLRKTIRYFSTEADYYLWCADYADAP